MLSGTYMASYLKVRQCTKYHNVAGYDIAIVIPRVNNIRRRYYLLLVIPHITISYSYSYTEETLKFHYTQLHDHSQYMMLNSLYCMFMSMI